MNSGQIKSLATSLCLCGCALDDVPAEKAGLDQPPGAEAPAEVSVIGRLDTSRISESSGVVLSRKFPGVFWTHNDGGGRNRQQLFAITRQGKILADFSVQGVRLRDWEDIAIDDQRHLFVGDIGNNDAKRLQLAVYQIDEPDPKSSGPVVQVKRQWHLLFPKAPFDCESLFVFNGYGYVISKVFKDKKAELYRFPLTEQKEPAVLQFVSRLRIDSPVTGADLSPDGKLMAVVSKGGASVWKIDGVFDKLSKMKPFSTRFRHEHIEACCFVPEGLLATAESGEIFLFTNEAFRCEPIMKQVP